MLSELHEDEKALVLSMRAVHALCDDAGDVATASLLENWIDESQRRSWFLFEGDAPLNPAGKFGFDQHRNYASRDGPAT